MISLDLYKEILVKILEKHDIKITFCDFNINERESIESVSYKMLQKIKTIIEDDSLCDKECFKKIEEIICVFEELGSNCGNRHDF